MFKKKMFKTMLSFIFVLLTIFSSSLIIISSNRFNIDVHATESMTNDEFLKYVREHYNSADHFVADTIIYGLNGSYSIYDLTINSEVTPMYKLIAEEVVNDTSLVVTSTLWKELESCLDFDFVSMVNWKETFYEMLLMDYLAFSCDDEKIESEFVAKSGKYATKLLKGYLESQSAIYSIEYDDLIGDTEIENSEFADYCENIGTVLDIAELLHGTIKESSEKIGKILAYQDICQSKINLLKKMKKIAPEDEDLCKAVNNIIYYLDKSKSEITIETFFTNGIKYSLRFFLQSGWNKLVDFTVKAAYSSELVLDAVNAKKLLLSLQFGTASCDFFFNSDNNSEANLKMAIIYILDEYCETAVKESIFSYLDNPTQENSWDFVETYRNYIHFQKYATFFTKQFANQTLFEGAWNKLKNLFSDDNSNLYNKIVSRFNSDTNKCDTVIKMISQFYSIYDGLIRAANENIKLSFDSDGGSEIESIIVNKTGVYGDLPIPTKQGYKFMGWSLTPTNTSSTYFTKNTNVYFYAPNDWISNGAKIFCHLWDANSTQPLFSWKNESEICDYVGNNIYRYVIPAGYNLNGIIFASSNGFQTYDLALGTICENDVVYCLKSLTNGLYESAWMVNTEFKSIKSSVLDTYGFSNGMVDVNNIAVSGYKFVTSNMRVLLPKDHKLYAVWSSDHYYTTEIVAPTCTEIGYTLHICKNCNDSYKDTYTNALGHDYKLTSQTNATCTTDGKKVYTCSRCGDTKTETIKATGHNYTTNIVAPACIENGYTLHICKNCNDSYKDTYTNALEHDYKLTSHTNATCTTDGKKVYTCSRCGDTKTETIKATGHNYTTNIVAPACTENGYTLHICKNCNDSYKDTYTNALGHDYKLTSQTNATCTTDGKKVYTCSRCGDTKTETIKATGHNYTENVVAPTTTEQGYTLHTCSICGDSYKDNYVAPVAELANNSVMSTTTITVNKSVTLTAVATGGTAPYTYTFMYKLNTATSWKVIGTKFGTESTATFKPTQARTYDVLISVKDSTGKSVAKKFALTVTAPVVYASKSTINATDVTCGTKIILTGAAEGGSEPYYYTYQYQKPDKTSWITLGEKYGTAESANFTPKVAGTYKARVLVKDSKGTVKSSVFTVNVTGELLVNNSTINATTVTLGNKVTITTKTTGGTKPFYYTYEYKAPSASKWTTIGKRNSANITASFTPTSTGTYEARVYIKDAGGFVTVKNFKVTVK